MTTALQRYQPAAAPYKTGRQYSDSVNPASTKAFGAIFWLAHPASEVQGNKVRRYWSTRTTRLHNEVSFAIGARSVGVCALRSPSSRSGVSACDCGRSLQW